MIEPLFRSGSPFLAGIPSPAFGWLQSPPSLNARPATGAIPGIAASPSLAPTPLPFGYGYQNLLNPDAYAFGAPLNAFAFAGPPVATAPALLATVAVKRGQPSGPASDPEIEDFLYDALELLSGTNDVEVRSDGGRVTLTGSVPHRLLKRDVGEIAWAIPAISDVQNNVTIAARRRSRSTAREAEPHASASRKQA
jgi:hypothetical protein